MGNGKVIREEDLFNGKSKLPALNILFLVEKEEVYCSGSLQKALKH
jgi:hypothetical protein